MGSSQKSNGSLQWSALNTLLCELVAPPLGRVMPMTAMNQWTATGQPTHDETNPFGVDSPATRMPGQFKDVLGEDDSFKLLTDLLNGAIEPPAKQVEKGNPPFPSNVGVLPVGYTDENIMQNYKALIKMNSIASLYHTTWMVNQLKARGRDRPYNISDPVEAQQAFKDQADSAYQCMVGPLAGIYNINSSVANSFSRHFRKTEIHLGFLEEIFKNYSLSQAALLELDKTLQNFASAIANIQITNESKSDSVSNTVRINQVIKENISGDDSNPIWVYTPKTRIVYMAVKYDTWTSVTGNGKNRISDAGIDFQMQYVIVNGDLNVEAFQSVESQLDDIFKNLTKQNLEQFGNAMAVPPVKSIV